ASATASCPIALHDALPICLASTCTSKLCTTSTAGLSLISDCTASAWRAVSQFGSRSTNFMPAASNPRFICRAHSSVSGVPRPTGTKAAVLPFRLPTACSRSFSAETVGASPSPPPLASDSEPPPVEHPVSAIIVAAASAAVRRPIRRIRTSLSFSFPVDEWRGRASIALADRFLVPGVQPVVQHQRGEQDQPLDDVLLVGVHVQNRHSVDHHADQRGTCDDGQHTAAAADQADAADDDHQQHVVDQ